jgi:hypothetical protein
MVAYLTLTAAHLTLSPAHLILTAVRLTLMRVIPPRNRCFLTRKARKQGKDGLQRYTLHFDRSVTVAALIVLTTCGVSNLKLDVDTNPLVHVKSKLYPNLLSFQP